MKVNVVHFSNLSPHQQPAVSLKIYNPIKSWLQFDSSIPKSHLCFSLSSLLKNDYGRAVDQIKSGLSFEPRVEDKTLKFDICYSATTESDKNPENPLDCQKSVGKKANINIDYIPINNIFEVNFLSIEQGPTALTFSAFSTFSTFIHDEENHTIEMMTKSSLTFPKRKYLSG